MSSPPLAPLPPGLSPREYMRDLQQIEYRRGYRIGVVIGSTICSAIWGIITLVFALLRGIQ